MRYVTKTLEVTYKVFDIGEQVRPTSSRCVLENGTYVVTQFCHPLLEAGELHGIVFVEGREHGVSAEYLTSVWEE